MKFTPALKKATLLKRYRRFLTDIETESGEIITIHCPNTGSMLNCLQPNSEAWYQPSTDPNRKTKGTWVIATTPFQRLANVNTHLANGLVEEALENGVIDLGTPYKKLQREVKYGSENSRIDLRLTHHNADQETPEAADTYTYIEVKSVTLGFADSTIAAFPDAVTTRGTKHLRELTELAQNGVNAVLLYCVNLEGITAVRPADEIDPAYGIALRLAVKSGVRVLAYRADISPEEIKIIEEIPVILD